MMLLNTFSQKILFILFVAAAVFLSGFFYGHMSNQKAAQKATVKATLHSYKTREKIKNETVDLSLFDLCLALGGVQNDCAPFLPPRVYGVGKSPQSQ